MPFPELPASWSSVLAAELERPSFRQLAEFVARERAAGAVYPPEPQVFAAFEHTPFERVKVVLLGQDPYHGAAQAHGLAFSVPPGVPAPPSLVNVFKELREELGLSPPGHGCLVRWAQQGVLLLNAVLTVRAGAAGSHQKKGWEPFTDGVIRALAARREPVVFVLWGGYARKKAKLVDGARHRVLEAVHPSPLSAYTGFFGSRPFTRINEALAALGHEAIDWRLPEAPPNSALP